MVAAKRSFTTKVAKKEVVAAALPLQEQLLPLSNLDLLFPALDVGVFFCFDKSRMSREVSMGDGSVVGMLKRALSDVLVSYYAFAGELITSRSSGEPQLWCNNRGVDFVEAYVETELAELDMHKFDKGFVKFLPQKKDGVLAVQVTELKCGSLVVACSFDHRVADAYSANMFLQSWAAMARSEPVSCIPNYERSLLNPRQNLHVDPSIYNCYTPVSSIKPPLEPAHDYGKLVGRLYYVEADKIDELQAVASSGGCKLTKLEAFSAFLWKLVAKSAIQGCEELSTLSIAIDGRKRISGDRRKVKTQSMESRFGNVLSFPFCGHKASDINEKPISWVGKEVHGLIEAAAKEEHFLSLNDLVEAHRPSPVMPRIYKIGGPALLVSSGLRFPVRKIDFGWGPPCLGTYCFQAWGGEVGYVMPTPSAVVEGDWVVYMLLRERQLDFIEEIAGEVFRPMTGGYLNPKKIN